MDIPKAPRKIRQVSERYQQGDPRLAQLNKVKRNLFPAVAGEPTSKSILIDQFHLKLDSLDLLVNEIQMLVTSVYGQVTRVEKELRNEFRTVNVFNQ
jgi:hypothetical protein